MKKTIALLPGDGVGQEVMKGAIHVLKAIEKRFGHSFCLKEVPVGGAAIDLTGSPLPEKTLKTCKNSDAVLLGAVGGPKWENHEKRPEDGLLKLRQELGVYVNLRPVQSSPTLLDLSPLKSEFVKNTDLLIVRELTGGLYFGDKKREKERAEDSLVYHKYEIERTVRRAYEEARNRKGKLTSVDKANVLESSRLWRETVSELSLEYSDVETEHLLVDHAAMKLILKPSHFDVIVTENMFGDILSDEASVLLGTIGVLPSASMRDDDFGLYEPVHGSAPDIAGTDRANPIGMVMSVAMMLKHSFHMHEESEAVERAVQEVMNAGYRTADMVSGRFQHVSTSQFIDQIVIRMEEDAVSASLLELYV